MGRRNGVVVGRRRRKIPKPIKSLKHPAKRPNRALKPVRDPYGELLGSVVELIEQSRLGAVRSVNVLLTSTYWLVGQRIVEHEQSGEERAAYGEELIERLAQDLTARLGRGFSERNIRQMRLFYLSWPIRQTVSAKFGSRPQFPLQWSHYVRLLSVNDQKARSYYEGEALIGGWSARQLDRQIATLAYHRTRGARSLATKDEASSARCAGERSVCSGVSEFEG